MPLQRIKLKLTNPPPGSVDVANYANRHISWDDWVPQDRLRKFNDDNKELANHLKKEMETMRARSQKTSTHKKRTAGSARDSEERSSTAPRGQKRGRDFEIEKVSRGNFTPSYRSASKEKQSRRMRF